MNWTTIKAAVGNAIKTAKNAVVAWWTETWKVAVSAMLAFVIGFWVGFFSQPTI